MKSIKIIEKTFEVLILTFATQQLLVTSAKTLFKLKKNAKNAFISGLLSGTLSQKHANTDIADIFNQVNTSNNSQNLFSIYSQYFKSSYKLSQDTIETLRNTSLNTNMENIRFQYASIIRNHFLKFKILEKYKDHTMMLYIIMLPLIATSSLNMFISVVFFQMGNNVAKIANIFIPDPAKTIVKAALYLDYFLNIQDEILNVLLVPLKGAELIIDAIAIFSYGVYESLDKKVEIEPDKKSIEKDSSISEKIVKYVKVIKEEIEKKVALSDLKNKKLGNAEYKAFMLGVALTPKLFVKKSTLTWVQKLEYCKIILEATIDTAISHILASSYHLGRISGQFINYLASNNKKIPQKNAAQVMREEKKDAKVRTPVSRKACSKKIVQRKS